MLPLLKSQNHAPLIIKDQEVDPVKEKAIRNKQLLNKDFFENAKIRGLVGYRWYYQNEHSEIDIEGTRHYTLLCSRLKDIPKKSYKPSKQAQPYIRFKFTVTPKELASLNAFVKGKPIFFGTTCAHSSAKVLSQCTKIAMPPWPISFIPSFSSAYLLLKNYKNANKTDGIDYKNCKPGMKGKLGPIINSVVMSSLLVFVSCAMVVDVLSRSYFKLA